MRKFSFNPRGVFTLYVHLPATRCIVEAFVMGGRADFTSPSPPTVNNSAPGTAVKLFSGTGIRVSSATVHSMGCGWTDPPYIGDGPFTH